MTFGEPSQFYTSSCNTVELFTLEGYQLFISLFHRSRTNWRICSRKPNTACTNLTIRHLSELHQPTVVRNHFPDVPLMVLHTLLHSSNLIFPNTFLQIVLTDSWLSVPRPYSHPTVRLPNCAFIRRLGDSHEQHTQSDSLKGFRK